jgi:RNA polymerase sigma factor (sigma-70 family)
MTADLITQSQSGKADATLALINKFNPLIKKYAYLLHHEDAYDDLLVDFIQLVHDIDLDKIHNRCEGGLVLYISKTMRRIFIKKSRQKKSLQNVILLSELKNNQIYHIESLLCQKDNYFQYELPSIKYVLTRREALVIQMIYVKDYSSRETAQRLGISRQAVNQMKNRALKKLKTQLMDKP